MSDWLARNLFSALGPGSPVWLLVRFGAAGTARSLVRLEYTVREPGGQQHWQTVAGTPGTAGEQLLQLKLNLTTPGLWSLQVNRMFSKTGSMFVSGQVSHNRQTVASVEFAVVSPSSPAPPILSLRPPLAVCHTSPPSRSTCFTAATLCSATDWSTLAPDQKSQFPPLQLV